MICEFRVDKHTILLDLEPEQYVSDANMLWYAHKGQLPEPEVIHVMLRALKAGDCAVDAGANIGFFTVLMSKRVGERGKILALEPDPRNVEKLKKNLDINSCANVEIWPYALAETDGRTALYRQEDNGQSSIFGEGKIGDVVPLVTTSTLDRALVRLPKHPRLLKMDIEGSEVAALKGCTFDFPCIVTEVNERALARAGHTPVELFTILRERGYVRYQLHHDGSMPSRIEYGQTVKFTRDNANMLFAPRDYVAKQLWPEVEI